MAKSLAVTKEEKTVSVDHVATGQKMRQLRVAARLSLRSVASQMAHSAAYVSDLELGKRAWTEDRCQWFLAAVKYLSE